MNNRIPNHDPLNGLRVAVTGGTSGLGRALVRGLRARKAHVAFVARDAERVARSASPRTSRTGTRSIVWRCNCSAGATVSTC